MPDRLAPGRRPFDPGAPERARARIGRIHGWMNAIVAVVLGAMLAGVAEDWRVFPPAAAGTALFLVLLRRAAFRLRFSVYCRGCPGAGWIDDLAPSLGRCPLCGGSRFDYRGWTMRGRTLTPLHTDDVEGAWLLEQRRESGEWH